MAHHVRGSTRFTSGAGALGGLAVTLGVLACRGASDTAVAWDGAVRDSAGIEIVENFGTPLWREEEGWTFTEVLRIGAVEGVPEYEFGRISGIAVLSDRRIVVGDALAHTVRFFSPEGVHQRTVGRQGQGPGEFGAGSLTPLVGRGDTLLVIDAANAQAHVLAPDGTWLESFSTVPDGHYRIGLWRNAPASGRIVSHHMPMRQSDGTLRDTVDILLERDVHGTVLDTLARIPSYLASVSRRRGAPPYYIDVVDISFCEGGLVTGRNYEYRSVWYDAGGRVNRIVSLVGERLPLTEADRLVMLGRYDLLVQEWGPSGSAMATQLRSNVHFTDTYPHYSRVTCGPAGTLIVQRVRPLRQLREEESSRIPIDLGRPPGSLQWDVFDREGHYLGRAELPGTAWVANAIAPTFVQDGDTGTWYMYTAWSDEQDVQYVIGWRIDGPIPD